MSNVVVSFSDKPAGFDPEMLVSGDLRHVGRKVAISDWVEVTQADTELFGKATKDPDPMHDDPQWARENSPFGQTIAYGFQTLSLLSHLNHLALPWPESVKYGLNYGLDRVRFLSPVRVPSKVRTHIVLDGFSREDEKTYTIQTTDVVEIEGETRPALIAKRLGRLVMK